MSTSITEDEEEDCNGNPGRGTISILKKYADHCVIKATRGVGPREIGEVWLPQQNVRDVFLNTDGEDSTAKCLKTIQLNPHYRAYARGLLLVARNKAAAKAVSNLQLTVHCLCKGYIKPTSELILEHTVKKSLCKIHVQGIKVVPSNTAGHISLVAIRNEPGDAIKSRQFRSQMKLNGTPILGNGQDAQSFRGENLCMSVTQLQFELEGKLETISLGVAPRFQVVMEREERFWKEKGEGGIPTAYQMGRCQFDGLELVVNPSVMIPRPASEAVIHTALEIHKQQQPTQSAPRVLDLGTGSGCLLVSLLNRLPNAIGVGVDKSKDALQVASQNVSSLGLTSRCSMKDGDFGRLDQLGEDPFDICVCNPPYHTRGGRKQLEAATVAHEPALALFVDNDTETQHNKYDMLIHYRNVLQGLNQANLAKKGTVLVFEVFKDNASQVMNLMQEHGWQQVEMGKDAKGCIRTAAGVYGMGSDD